MSLDTVLKIGKALRESEDNLKHYRYAQACPRDTKTKKYPLCISIPLDESFEPQWDMVYETPENEKSSLYYLLFKTSEKDTMVKYIFGDIYYSQESQVSNHGEPLAKSKGYYRLPDLFARAAYRNDSFNRGEADFQDILKNYDTEGSIIQLFRERFKMNIKAINTILANIPSVEYYFANPSVDIPFSILLKDHTILAEFTIRQNLKLNSSILKKMKIVNKALEKLTDEEKCILSKYAPGEIFLNFRFPGNKHWCDFKKDFEIVSKKMLSDFVDLTTNGYVMSKTLYKTLCSGNDKNDIQFPAFQIGNRHKSRVFNNDDLHNLFYAIDYSSKGRLIFGTDIKMITLPRGENLTAEDFERFLEKKDEDEVIANNNQSQQLFIVSHDRNPKITSFDFIFCKKGGKTSPEKDLIEISGIQKSQLKRIRERIETIADEVSDERKQYIKTDKDLFPLDIGYSFRQILGIPRTKMDTGKVSYEINPQYESHLLKVLPLVYTENYHHDEILLPAFIQNVEYSIRAGDPKYSFLKYDFIFLLRIQNSKNNKYMELIESKCYQIGNKLGKMSRPLKSKINSFEKNYVGLLTRRIATRDECIEFFNDINEMLIMNVNYPFGNLSAEVSSELVNLPFSEYDKEKLAFGFFEGYFKWEAPDDKEKFFSGLERYLNNYIEKEGFSEVIEKLFSVIDEERNQ